MMKKKLYIGVSLCVASALTVLFTSKVFANNAYVLTFTKTGNHTLSNDNGHLKIDGSYVELKDANDNENNIGTVACTEDSSSCTITVDDGTEGQLSFSSQDFVLYVNGHRTSFDTTYNANENFAVQDYEEDNNQNNNPNSNQGTENNQVPGTNNQSNDNNNQSEPNNQGNENGEEEPHNFDGKAYLIWSCKSGGICFKHFDNIPGFDDGNSTFYKDTDIQADNKNETFDINAEYKAWSTDDRFEAWVDAYKKYKNIADNEDIDWSKVNPADMIGDPIDMGKYEEQAIKAGACTRDNIPQDEFEACVDNYVAKELKVWASRAQLQPLGEPDYNNAYTSYGDRNFKVVIYNSNYKGVAMGSLDSLSYYPSEWTNAFIKRDQFDISGTTKENPTVIDSILLEKTVVIKEINKNNYSISSIEALDVPLGAVTINKENGEWKLTFSSNYYDGVVFKATDSNGGESYFKIKRYTIDGYIKFVDNSPVVNADFYFDRTKSYNDFNLTAVIEYKDGTEKNITLDAVYGIDDGLGNITEAYEVDEENPTYGPAGKGLKKASFQYKLKNGEDRQIKRIYLNAEYKGSTKDTYAGNFAGSGKGVLANLYEEEE